MHLTKYLLLIHFLISFLGFSQVKPVLKGRATAADCSAAIPLKLSTSTSYGVTNPLSGFGAVQEIHHGSNLIFEEEHNTAWYLLSIEKSGELIFDIIPQDTANDYDFLLYSYADSTFCDAFKKNKLKPVRSNLSNVKLSKKGITGLAKSHQLKTSAAKGVGNPFSKSLAVKKGEKYMLILDNVTPLGKGHTLEFYFLKDVEIKGKVFNADSMPLVSDITLSDTKGNTVMRTKSDAKGDYMIKTGFKEFQNYNLTVESDSAFTQMVTLNTKDLIGKTAFSDMKLVLPKLKSGGKYKLGNINFYGDQARLLPESQPSVEALYKLMLKNKKMVIQIEGHCNSGREGIKYTQKLSEERAQTIYSILITKGIDKKRMSTAGFGTSKMLYPTPQNEAEAQANRRVEINVISIK